MLLQQLLQTTNTVLLDIVSQLRGLIGLRHTILFEGGYLLTQPTDGDGLALVGGGGDLGELGGIEALGLHSVLEEKDELLDFLLALEVERTEGLVILVEELQRFIHNGRIIELINYN